MYPNLPDHEAAALTALGPRGLSPQLIEHRPGVITYRFVPGPMWRRGVSEVAVVLHTIHSGPAPGGLRRLCASAQEARAHGDEMTNAVPIGAARELRACRPVDVSPAAVRRRSLVHTDCGPGNIVRSRNGLVLIDWQCPGLGDAVEDIACFLSPAMMILYGFRPHTARASAQFLSAYGDAAVVERYRQQGASWHYRIGAYCVWRADRLARRLPDIATRYLAALSAEIDFLKSLP